MKIDVRAEKEQEQKVVEGEKSRHSSIRYTSPVEDKCFICNTKLYWDSHRCDNQRWHLETPGSNHAETNTRIIVEAAKFEGPVMVKVLKSLF